jgi:hypothetical protein
MSIILIAKKSFVLLNMLWKQIECPTFKNNIYVSHSVSG